jgi:transcriptional regulator with XRE-family HTH domain
MKNLADRLSWARTQKGLSQDQLAINAGVSQSTIGNLEAGIRLTARKITSIANALEVDAMWLAEGVGSPVPTSPINSAPTPRMALVEKSPPPQISLDAAKLAKLIDLFVRSTEHGQLQILEFAEVAEKTHALFPGKSAND